MTDRFRRLFEEHHELVYRFLYCLCGDEDDARELAQETFFRAYKTLGAFEERSAASTWLCGIARNVAFNHFRSRKVRLHIVEEPRVREGPEERAMTAELRETIRGALLALDEEKRTAFTLKILQRRSYEEIAAITGATIGKLKTDVHRARLHMRELLAKYLEGR
ncbi:MAG TPA: sigma-70 family RNA polymerase sigma factor [Thermoanaerobaculia bacterium]|nr:sigma-70 family RNA polymerase sigma factor [Thermoanaerobaculia bacterium]